MNGIVKWFHPRKGLGYVERAHGLKMLFRFIELQFGSAALQNEVTFEVEDFRLVPRARQVGRIGTAGKAIEDAGGCRGALSRRAL